MTLTELLKEVIQALEHRQIQYMISGSLAMSVYTVPRMTRDIDIVIELNTDNLETFIPIFSTNFYVHRPSLEEEVRRQGMFNVIDHRSGYKIDFVVRKNTPFRRKEFERRIRSQVLDIGAWVVSIEDLIISKLIWIQEIQSDQQKSDIENLLDTNTTDRSYLLNWIKQLDLKTYNLV